MGRTCHVYDYEGEHLASFTTWDAAHEWAHLQAALGSVATPVEIEDRRHRRLARRVWADRCEQMHADVVPLAHEGLEALELARLCVGAAALSFAPPLPRMPS